MKFFPYFLLPYPCFSYQLKNHIFLNCANFLIVHKFSYPTFRILLIVREIFLADILWHCYSQNAKP